MLIGNSMSIFAEIILSLYLHYNTYVEKCQWLSRQNMYKIKGVFSSILHKRRYLLYSLIHLQVYSISSSVCASDTNIASNCEGAIFTPFDSINL